MIFIISYSWNPWEASVQKDDKAGDGKIALSPTFPNIICWLEDLFSIMYWYLSFLLWDIYPDASATAQLWNILSFCWYFMDQKLLSCIWNILLCSVLRWKFNNSGQVICQVQNKQKKQDFLVASNKYRGAMCSLFIYSGTATHHSLTPWVKTMLCKIDDFWDWLWCKKHRGQCNLHWIWWIQSSFCGVYEGNNVGQGDLKMYESQQQINIKSYMDLLNCNSLSISCFLSKNKTHNLLAQT